MPIFDKYKAIHVHIPKTAGTTVSRSLGLLKDNIHDDNHEKQKKHLCGPLSIKEYGVPYQHLTASQIKEVVGEEVYNEYFKFAFIRNPWDRIASEFRWAQQNTPRHYSGRNDEFDQLVRDLENEDIDKYKQRLKPQVLFLKNEQGHIDIDYLGRYENFENDWMDLGEQLGFPLVHNPNMFKDGTLGFLVNNSKEALYTRVDKGEQIMKIEGKSQVPAFLINYINEKDNNDDVVIEIAFKENSIKENRPDRIETISVSFLRKSQRMNVKYYHDVWGMGPKSYSGYMDEFFNFDFGIGAEERPSVDINDCLIIDLVKIFKTDKGDYKKYYNDWSRKVVEKFYEEDVDTFKYTF